MSMLSVLLTTWMLQTAADHQAIVQTASDFAKHVKSRDANKMATCMRLVCNIEDEEQRKLELSKPSHARYALAECKYILAYQDCAQVLLEKHKLSLPCPDPQEFIPVESDISVWVNSIKNCTSIQSAIVANLRCFEYRLKFGGQLMTQRFVKVEGKWYLGSLPFTEMSCWDQARNDSPVYAISSLAVCEIPMYLRGAKNMAEDGKTKQEVIKYLQMYYLLPREEVVQAGGGLPVPPTGKR